MLKRMRQTVLTRRLDGWHDPADAYLAVCGDADEAFWLDSGVDAVAGWSYLGLPSAVRLPGTRVLDAVRVEPVPAAADAPPFALGTVFWLGYEVRAETTGVPVSRASGHPDAALLDVDRMLAFDHARREVLLVARGVEWTPELERWAEGVVAALETPPRHPAHDPAATGAVWAYDDATYRRMILDCQVAIRAGEAYQLCLTNLATVEVSPDPVAAYLALRRASPAHHGGLLRAGGVALLSASPELFLTVTPEGTVRTSPIKGTRPRGVDAASDAALIVELAHDEKELAENLMIVDLMRNDLGRICEVGSVAVTALHRVESYAQVHQLVSTVEGRLAAGCLAADVIGACFPAGSMTGAPKIRATEILDLLEARPRGLYSGAFGYLGSDGALELAMTIRSIVIDAERSTVGAGGGITALSVPEREVEEVRWKARALLAVLGAV